MKNKIIKLLIRIGVFTITFVCFKSTLGFTRLSSTVFVTGIVMLIIKAMSEE